jgi:hypothetical protein
MNMVSRTAAVAAVAAVGLGAGAASAAAYSISGGSYVGTATSAHTFTVAGAFTLTCPASTTTFTGTATGAASSNFTPSYGPGCTFFGLPASVTQSGQWTATVTSGGPSTFGGNLHIPASSTTTIEVPSTGCTVRITGTQNFSGVGTTTNVPGGVQASFHVSGIVYKASGCPFASGSDGTYSTNGNVDIPGITIS